MIVIQIRGSWKPRIDLVPAAMMNCQSFRDRLSLLCSDEPEVFRDEAFRLHLRVCPSCQASAEEYREQHRELRRFASEQELKARPLGLWRAVEQSLRTARG